MPDDVRETLKLLDLVALGGAELNIVPFECMGLSGYDSRLLAAALLPLGLVALAPLPSLALAVALERRSAAEGLSWREWRRRVMSRAWSTSISLWLQVLYFLYPIISSLSFLAFDCETFVDESGAHKLLRSDYAIECTNEGKYLFITTLSWACIVAAIVTPCAILILLLGCRSALLAGRATPLTRATRFIHDEYSPRCFWWEVAETLRKLYLVGLTAVIFTPGTCANCE